MRANTSWNAAFASIAVCAAAFFASVITSTTGWHAVAAGRAAGGFAVAMIASGVWLHLAAARLEPEDGDGWVPMDERPECPYDCDHGDGTEGTP